MIFQGIILFILFYLWGNIFFYAVDAVKSSSKQKRPPKIVDKSVIPKLSLKEKISKYQKYAFTRMTKSKFPKNKWLLIILLILFPLLTVVSLIFLGFIKSLLLSIFLHIVYTIVTLNIVKEPFENEYKLLNKILQFKRQYMGLIDSNTNVYDYQSEFVVSEWNENNDYPIKMTFIFSPAFDKEKRITFMEELSKKFGKGKYWFAEESDWQDADDKIEVENKKFYDEPSLSFIKNFIQMKKQNMGLLHPESGIYTYTYEFTIDGVDSNNYPDKLSIFLPIGYDPLQQDSFLEKITTQLGRGRPWEVDEEAGGWDITNQVAHIVLLQPLPGSAPWSAEYVLNPDVAWSFFPLGIGSKGGFDITNRETGQVERINGIDVNGAQWKLLKKNGKVTGLPPADLLNSPQALGAGVSGTVTQVIV